MSPSKNNTKNTNKQSNPDSTITLALANISLVMVASLGFLLSSSNDAEVGGNPHTVAYQGIDEELVSRNFSREDYDQAIDSEVSEEKIEAREAQKEQETRTTLVSNVKKYEGVTPYVWAGETPRGWDCSGLVVWAYRQIGVAVPHNSTALKSAGEVVSNPRAGDVVIFGWQGRSRAQHAGLYVSQDTMIHSGGRSGYRTEVESISKWAGMNGNTKVLYIRVLED